MSDEISILAVLLAGALSFLSPCVLPLVPPYLTYLAGVTVEELTGDGAADRRGLRRRVITNALLFVLGFSTVFILLGAGASTMGAALRFYQRELSIVAGLVIIVMGLHFLGVFRIGLLYREVRFNSGQGAGSAASTGAARGLSLGGSFLMGLAFAFGWTPCIGPVLGAVLSVAGARDSAAEGAGLLAIYSAGLGIPFMLSALFAGSFMRFLTRFKKHIGRIEQIMGALLVLTGILFLTGGMQDMAFFLLETFPALQQLG